MDALPVTIGEAKLYAGAKVFSTGSRGFYLGDKVTLENGKRYQVTMSIVEIGSKPNGKPTPKK